MVPGVQTVTRALGLRPDGTRGVYVDPDTCPNTVREYLAYEYEQGNVREARGAGAEGGEGAERVVSERPVEVADHAMDATRYALHSERRVRERPTAEGYLRDLERWAAVMRDGRRQPPAPWH